MTTRLLLPCLKPCVDFLLCASPCCCCCHRRLPFAAQAAPAPAKTEAASKPAAEPASKPTESATKTTATTATAATTGTTTAAAADSKAAGAKGSSKDAGGLDKTVQDAVSRAAQMAAEDVIARGGTKEQANAAGAKAAQAVLAQAKSGKSLPSGANVTPTIQQKVSAAAEKAARDVIMKGGTQAQANAAGEKAAKTILSQYSFSG